VTLTTDNQPATTTSIQLSVPLLTFAAQHPGTWTPMLERAQLLDRCGVDRLVVSEHVVFGERLDEYARPEIGGSRGGSQPTGPDGHWLDPLVVLSHVSALTTRIRLGTGVLLAAIRRPVVLAKTAATLDVLSGGRLDLGVGVGWQSEEYEAAGLEFGERGKVLDHTLEVCQALWTAQAASHSSRYLQFDKIHQMPKPLSATGVPIWVSGTVNRSVARRISRFGTGWIPWGEDAADLVSAIPRMRNAVGDAGGDPDGLQIAASLRPQLADSARIDAKATIEAALPLVEAGATDLRASFIPGDPSEAEDLLSEMVPLVRAMTRNA
jgi:probable F420-dependent oxidoreductase